jgi:hypothetical protein
VSKSTNGSVEKKIGDQSLCFQHVLYVYADDLHRAAEYGYRFMWRGPRGLSADRGQARIPSLAILHELVAMGEKAGWAHLDAHQEKMQQVLARGDRETVQAAITDASVGIRNEKRARRAGVLSGSLNGLAHFSWDL